jgi:hypothetical protein
MNGTQSADGFRQNAFVILELQTCSFIKAYIHNKYMLYNYYIPSNVPSNVAETVEILTSVRGAFAVLRSSAISLRPYGQIP